MKAISIRQPFASLIMLGYKSIETRSRTTSHRGQLAIHASKHLAADGPQSRAGWALLARHGLTPETAPRQLVLGTVHLTDSRPAEDLTALITPVLSPKPGALPELALGHYGPGRHGWILRDPKTLQRPAPARGWVSFWEWTP